jgi:Bromodomain associated
MQQSALDVLSDLLLRYIGEMGSTTRSYSELGHRMAPTSEDLVLEAT